MRLRPFLGGVIECLSRMKGNFQARFLGGLSGRKAARLPGEARPHKKRGERYGALGRAFDKAVRRKPLAGAADAGCYGNSIDFCLKSLARRGVLPKRCY